MAEAATWDVYVMEYARSKNQPWDDLISGMYHEGVMDLPFSFVFAQRDEDRVLIDTGFMQDDHRSTFSRKFGIPTWISPLRMLAEIGVHAHAINAVFVTHAHFDHMGSIAEFPNAHIYIQKSELLSWYEAFALPKRFGHLTAIVDPDTIRTALDASIAHRVPLIDGDKNDVLPGFTCGSPAVTRSDSSSSFWRRRWGAESSPAIASIPAVSSRVSPATASTCRSTTRSEASGSSSSQSTR